eukprot:s3308_g9.t3
MAIWRCVKNGDALPKLASAGGKVTYKSMSRLGWSPSAAGWSWHNDVVNVSLDVNQAGFVHVADKLAHCFVSLGGVACFAHARRMANHTAFAVWVVLLTPGPIGVALMKIDLALFAMLHWHWTLGITWLGLVRSTFLQGVSLSAACRLEFPELMSSHGWVCSLSIPLRASSVLVLSNFHFATGALSRSDLWPNPLYGFTNNNRLGSTPKRDAVDSDFRHYYHLAALELLLVHHGFRPCETTLSSQQDMHQLEKTISAVEAFQRNRSLPSDPLGLNGPFWEEVVVPVKPGDESAAVLALRWMLQSTSQVSRPPLWDTMEVERHGCQAQLDASMQAQIQGSLAADAELMDEFNASWPVGLPSSAWRHLLQRAEQRVASGCLGRAFVARAFGVAWVFVWCLSAGFFAFFHIDGWNHGSSEKACMEPKTFRKVLRFGHEVALLGVVMLSHSLSVLGLWSFPSDLVSQVFVGFQITAAAVVAVRLAAKRGRRLPPEKNCIKYSAPILLMVLGFLFYCLVSLAPGLHGLLYTVFLAGLLAAWSIAVLVIADWNRVMKCGLFFAMWILAFAAPTLLSLLVGLLGTFGFWLSAFTPVPLLLLSLAAERLIGPLIEAKCEYTAETNWMLALLFRMCIEQVRFNTALAVLLLSLLAQRGFGPFLLHLVQSFLFAVALRRPKIACTSRDALASAPHGAFCRYLFHASQIVSHTGSGAIWQYRSEAVVLPLEIALFLTHMFQLILVGMPVGISAASWWLGLVLLVLFSTAREIVSGVLSIWRRMLFPHIPWSALPGHLIAIVLGVAMATATFSQVHFLWFFYAHHWAVCYIGGPSSTGMEVVEDEDTGGSIMTGVIGVVLLVAHVYSFCLWSLWLGRLECARQPSKERSRNKQELVQAFRRSASLTLDDRQQKKAMLVRVNSMTISGLAASYSEIPDEEETEKDEAFEEKRLGSAWERTLTYLWEDRDGDSPSSLPGVPQDEGSTSQEGRERRVSSTDATVDAESHRPTLLLLEEPVSETAAQEEAPELARTPDSEHLLNQVLKEVQSIQPDHKVTEVEVGFERVESEQSQAMSWTLNGTEVQALLGDTSSEDLRAAGVGEEAKSPQALSGSRTQDDLERHLKDLMAGADVAQVVTKLAEPTPMEEQEEERARREEEEEERRGRVEAERAEAERRRQEEERLLEEERLAKEAADRAEREAEEAAERERLERLAAAEREKAAAEEAAAAAAAAEREAAEEARREAERARAERARAEREAAERAAREAQEAAAREAQRRKLALEALCEAMASRSKEQIEICLQTAEEDGIPEKDAEAAVRVLHQIAEMEAIRAAEHRLRGACGDGDPEEIVRAITHATEVGVGRDTIDAANETLSKIREEIQKREAATKRLREILLKPPNPESSETLEERISGLSEAISAGKACRVPQADLQAAAESLQVLEGLRRRELATQALMQALESQDLQAAKKAYSHAKECGLSVEELVSFEHLLRDLSDALELAGDKERLMERRVAAAVEAKSQAERMESSAEVEKMLGEGGVIVVLKDAIQEAKKARLVSKGAIARAEAVVPETIADLKRIIADKQLNEKRVAEQRLRGEVELVQEAGILHVGVLEGLRNAIAEATRFSADVRDAEQVLAQLTRDLEKMTLEAKSALSQAFEARSPVEIRKGISACRQLLLNEEHAGAMVQLRSITEEDIALARSEHDREARMARVSILEQFVGVLRDNGDKQLRGFHNDLQDLKGALRVFCRVRPLNGREIKKNDTIAVEILDSFTVAVNKSETDKQTFAYDAIFGQGSSQADVFVECKGLVQSMIDGYNVTVFTYGQTGAGKTWTLYGSGAEPGLSPRLCEEVFRVVHRDREKLEFEVRASMIELYLSDLRDLLSKNKEPPKLELKSYKQADGTVGQRLEGVTETLVRSSDDLVKAILKPGWEAFACQACDFDVCSACKENGLTKPEAQLEKMKKRIHGYTRPRSYADEGKQAAARALLPAAFLDGAHARGGPVLLLELLKWFKSDFFKWVDSPSCEHCSPKNSLKHEGMTEPCEEELRYGATRVEAWRCDGCQSLVRFPRYDDPERLLETRRGRCGEWANCFTLIATALGYQARLVVDWTDHVWTEVWYNDKWHHCDPCEACLDAPLTYEVGWGKKLTYIVAFGQQEVVDVTARYTRDWASVLARRTALSEEHLAKIIEDADSLLRGPLPAPAWRQQEESELQSCKTQPEGVCSLSAAELCGRTSGSAEWRQERGELGASLPILESKDSTLIHLIDPGCVEVEAVPRCSRAAKLLSGAALGDLSGVRCLELRMPMAEVEVAASDIAPDAFLSEEGFTVEAWVAALAEELHPLAHANPLISRHGPASGWELRLCATGAVVFLVTVDGKHWELESPSCCEWRGQWIHVAGTFDGEVSRVFVGKEPGAAF